METGERELRALFDAIDEPVAAVRDGRVELVNGEGKRVFGDIEGMEAGELLDAPLLDPGGGAASGMLNGVPVTSHRLGGYTVITGRIQAREEDEVAAAIGSASFVMTNALNSGAAAVKLIAQWARDEGNVKLLRYGTSLSRSMRVALRTSRNCAMIFGPRPAAPHLAPEDIGQVLSDLTDTADLALSQEGIRVVYVPPEEPVVCLADRELVELAVLNLISNSAKFAGKGCTVTVALIATPRGAAIKVTDDGPGIPQEEMSTAFRAYTRARDLGRPTVGAGLGLAVVNLVAGLHGGSCVIPSRDEGAGVVIFLPRGKSGTELRSPREDNGMSLSAILTELSDAISYSTIMKLENK